MITGLWNMRARRRGDYRYGWVLLPRRNRLARGRTHEARHRARGDDRVLLRIGLVVLFDVLEIVKVIRHQTVRLLQRPLRGVGEEVEPLEPRAERARR